MHSQGQGLQGTEVTRNGVDLFNRCASTSSAKEASKRFWGYRSVIDDRSRDELIKDGDSLDGAHLYPAGMPKFRRLAKLPANIFPMSRHAHRQWDALPIHKKIGILIDECDLDKRQLIVDVVERLGGML